MAINQIGFMAPRQEPQRQEQPKKDWKDYLLEGLQIANGIAGLGANVQTIREKQNNIEAQNLEAQGVLNPKQILAAQQAGLEISDVKTPGSMPYKVVEDSGTPKDIFIRKNAGLDPQAQLKYDLDRERLYSQNNYQNKMLELRQSELASKKAEKAQEVATKPPTEAQLLSANFGRKAQDANAVIQKIEGSGYDPASYGRAARDLPLIGSMTKNDNDRAYEQAQKEFIAAVLRKESGGAITKDEFSEYGAMYFPRAGDGPEVIAQKALARDKAAKSLLEMAGDKASSAISNRDLSGINIKQKQGFQEAYSTQPKQVAHPQDEQALIWAKANLNSQDPITKQKAQTIINSIGASKSKGSGGKW